MIWLKHFPEEPFDLDESKEICPQEFPNGLVSKIGYNIEEAALRQRDFYYQVRNIFFHKACDLLGQYCDEILDNIFGYKYLALRFRTMTIYTTLSFSSLRPWPAAPVQ